MINTGLREVMKATAGCEVFQRDGELRVQPGGTSLRKTIQGRRPRRNRERRGGDREDSAKIEGVVDDVLERRQVGRVITEKRTLGWAMRR